MKNQILIEHPQNAVYPPEMILLEKNVLASVLSHESGQKFVRLIFKSLFPQIRNSEQLFIMKPSDKVKGTRQLLSGIDGIIAYTNEQDYYIINVHSYNQSKHPEQSSAIILTNVVSSILETKKLKKGSEPQFFYLGLLPYTEPNRNKSRIINKCRLFSSESEERELISENIHIRLEAMKGLSLPYEGRVSNDIRWAFLLNNFGADNFNIPDLKENKYFKEFFETVRIKGRPEMTTSNNDSGKTAPNLSEYVFSDGNKEEHSIKTFMKEMEEFEEADNSSNGKTNQMPDEADMAVRVIVNFFDSMDSGRTVFDQLMHIRDGKFSSLN